MAMPFCLEQRNPLEKKTTLIKLCPALRENNENKSFKQLSGRKIQLYMFLALAQNTVLIQAQFMQKRTSSINNMLSTLVFVSFNELICKEELACI